MSSTQNPYQAPQTEFHPQFAYQEAAPPMSVGAILFSFQGRIPRRVYWGANILTTLGMLVVTFVAGFVAAALLGRDAERALKIINLPLQLLSIWISFAILAKRWHDRDKSGWWTLILLIPIVGAIWVFVELGCLRGTIGPNQYGLDPT